MALAAALLAGMSGTPSASVAQPAVLEASKKAAAAAADKAFEAFKQGKFIEALAGFEEADKAFHSPKFLLYVARTQAKLGRLLAAKGTYAKVIAEPLAPYAPAEFFAAQSDAKTELVGLVRRIPYLSVHAASGVGSLVLDGQPVSEGAKIAVDPGDHTLSGQTDTAASLQRKVRVAEGESKEVTLELAPAPLATATEPEPSGDSAGPAVVPDATAATGEPGAHRGIPKATVVAYGGAVAGLLITGIFGGLTLATKGDYDRAFNAFPQDPKKINAAADKGATFGLVTDIGLAVLVAGAAVGTIVWVVASRSPAKRAGASGRTLRIGVAPAAGGAAAVGVF